MFYSVIFLGDGHWETIKISNAHTVSTFIFFSDGTVMNPAIWLVLNVVLIFLSLPMGNSNRWKWIILSIRSLTAFQENIVVTVLAKLVLLLFLKCTCVFFLMCSLIDRCQIVTVTHKNNVSKFVGSLLDHLYHYANENVLVKLLSFIYITFILTTICLLKNCSVYGRSCCNYSPK